MGVEGWNRDQVAEFWGVAPSAVPTTMRQNGVAAIGREPGSRGQNVYPALEVRLARLRAPGRGRTAAEKRYTVAQAREVLALSGVPDDVAEAALANVSPQAGLSNAWLDELLATAMAG